MAWRLSVFAVYLNGIGVYESSDTGKQGRDDGSRRAHAHAPTGQCDLESQSRLDLWLGHQPVRQGPPDVQPDSGA